MTCYHPLKGWKSKTLTANGKRQVVFNPSMGFADLPVTVPCGQCVGCRLERSRQWAIRCSHEASLYEDNSFITLTYDDAHLPPNGSLNLRHFQLFMKRLRFYMPQHVRFYHCGEYGEKFLRPHYHACLFNCGFPDKKVHAITKDKNHLYTSEILSELWPMGWAIIGEVTFQSAAYVARYIMKKINGADQAKHYERFNLSTGEIFNVKPEYTTMSRRPGIGHDWLKKFTSDVYPSDFVVIGGRKMRAPKYYDRQFELTYPSDFEKVRAARVREAKKHADDQTPARLKVRETVKSAQLTGLPRKLEDG